MAKTQIILTVNQQSKAIPYPPASSTSSQNFGFRVLKGKLDKIAKVQEAKGTPCLQQALKVINDQGSPFFSVGCEKTFNQSSYGHWAKGYIEFAFNYTDFIADAKHYFPLFFHFSKHAASHITQHDVQFWWDLQPAQFVAVDKIGFSCCVWITTGQYARPEEARTTWEAALALLTEYLHSIPKPSVPVKTIY